jgi:hypothetical protein
MSLNVKINPGSHRDEVFIFSEPDDPNYVNRTVYAKPGLFTNGKFSAKHIEELESRSTKELEDDLNKTLAAEAKAREKEAAEAEAATKKASPKKEEE